MKGTAELLQNF